MIWAASQLASKIGNTWVLGLAFTCFSFKRWWIYQKETKRKRSLSRIPNPNLPCKKWHAYCYQLLDFYLKRPDESCGPCDLFFSWCKIEAKLWGKILGVSGVERKKQMVGSWFEELTHAIPSFNRPFFSRSLAGRQLRRSCLGKNGFGGLGPGEFGTRNFSTPNRIE